jgi:hypothetical protein
MSATEAGHQQIVVLGMALAEVGDNRCGRCSFFQTLPGRSPANSAAAATLSDMPKSRQVFAVCFSLGILRNMQFNYEGRIFRSISNSSNGEVGDDTRFHYHQQGNIVWATYGGGSVLMGTLIAKVNFDGSLDMRYQHLNDECEFVNGECHSVPEILPDGRYRLHEEWRWRCRDGSSGNSVVEEICE